MGQKDCWKGTRERRQCNSQYKRGLGCEHACGEVRQVEKKRLLETRKSRKREVKVLGVNDNKCLSSLPGWGVI